MSVRWGPVRPQPNALLHSPTSLPSRARSDHAKSKTRGTFAPPARDPHPTRGGGRLVTIISGRRITGAVAPSPPRSPSARASLEAATSRDAADATSGRCSSRRKTRASCRTEASTAIRRTDSGPVLLAAFSPSGFEAWNAKATTSKSDSPPSIARLGALVWIASSCMFTSTPRSFSSTVRHKLIRPDQGRLPDHPTVSVPELPERPALSTLKAIARLAPGNFDAVGRKS